MKSITIFAENHANCLRILEISVELGENLDELSSLIFVKNKKYTINFPLMI